MILLVNGLIVNEGKIEQNDILIKNGLIEKIGSQISAENVSKVYDLKGKYVFPGLIDDQVHFREPGLTHKATIASEARAAVAGGVTSFMEMPNTVPNTLSQELLEQKYKIAKNASIANYSFFMGGANTNYDEVMQTNLEEVCGLKIFMGSSTGNMLVDNQAVLEKYFEAFPGLIATHCEDETTVKHNLEKYKSEFENKPLPYDIHALIRNEEACYKSSSMAVGLAHKYNTRLHILHISSGQEVALFRNDISLGHKRITSEVCVHHLFFDANDYKTHGNKIKCNPAIKHNHREALLAAVLDNKIDVIATDHAPHTIDEKNQNYWAAPAGLPLVQHSLQILLDFYAKGKISLEKIAEKTAHAPADCFKIVNRGYIKEGYYADLVVVDLNRSQTISQNNIEYHCKWSPLEGYDFGASVEMTFVSGHLAYNQGKFDTSKKGMRLKFKKGD